MPATRASCWREFLRRSWYRAPRLLRRSCAEKDMRSRNGAMTAATSSSARLLGPGKRVGACFWSSALSCALRIFRDFRVEGGYKRQGSDIVLHECFCEQASAAALLRSTLNSRQLICAVRSTSQPSPCRKAPVESRSASSCCTLAPLTRRPPSLTTALYQWH